MICPYCRRRTRDMPDHLEAKPECREKHLCLLKEQFLHVVEKALVTKEKPSNDPLSAT